MTSRILHIINGEYYSGAERVQDLLAMRLPELGYQVDFVCLKTGIFPEMRQSNNNSIYEVSMRSRFDVLVSRKIAALVRENKYVLIHTHTPRTALIGNIVSRLSGVPMVHHVHSPTTRDSENRLKNHINSILEKLSLARAIKLIAVSQSLKKYLLLNGHPKNRIAVVHNGVPIQEWIDKKNNTDMEFVLGTVALFRPRKGLEILLAALARLKEDNLQFKLIAVGDFETEKYLSGIHNLADSYNLAENIEWVGFVKDVKKEFKNMDIFILPSLFGEGLPMVVLEAMSMGVAVIGTRVEGIPEVIIDGWNGLLVESGSVDGLYTALKKIMTGVVDRNKIIQNAYVHQKEHFSDESMAHSVAGIYKEILA